MRNMHLISRAEALTESRRCLGCYDAPCVQACPAGVNVPMFIRRLFEDNIQGSAHLIYQANPLAVTCGWVCPTSTLCEGACVLKDLGQTPIRIGALQVYASSQYEGLDETKQIDRPAKVAVIGAGPGGLGCAVQLARLGHRVNVFDQSKTLSGLVERVIPAHRLPREAVTLDTKRIQNMGIVFHLNQRIDKTQAEKLRAAYDAIFVAAGLDGINAFDVPGFDLPGVSPAMDYLEQASTYARGEAEPPLTGKKVTVIGGGNVALDAAVVAKRLGAERVIVLYRRTMEQMPGWESEYLEATALGVEFRWLTIVEEVVGNGDGVKAVKLASMRLGEAGSDGRRKVERDPQGEKCIMQCDQVIHALGQTLDPEIAKAFGLMINPHGTLAVDAATHRAGDLNIFAGGECVSGGSTVVHSMSQGMKAARKIDQWWMEKAGAA